jgi:hypothetical protein
MQLNFNSVTSNRQIGNGTHLASNGISQVALNQSTRNSKQAHLRTKTIGTASHRYKNLNQT